MNSSSRYQQSLVRERRRRRGWRRLQGGLRSGVLIGQRRPCASEGSRAWGAEREGSTSTHPMRMKFGKIVHASDEIGGTATVARMVRRAMAKEVTIRSRDQNAR
eukprot:5685824-Pleurochrysis_carterae.AAC.1